MGAMHKRGVQHGFIFAVIDRSVAGGLLGCVFRGIDELASFYKHSGACITLEVAQQMSRNIIGTGFLGLIFGSFIGALTNCL